MFQEFNRVGTQAGDSSTAFIIRSMLNKHRCKDLYLDLGTNIGVQPRKLAEPSCYPTASTNIFQQVFGHAAIDARSVCIFGFEPNRNHNNRLKKVERRLREQGVVIKIFTETGVGGEDAFNVSFFSDHAFESNEWGGGISPVTNCKRGVACRPNPTASGVTVVSMHSILQVVKDYGSIDRLLIKIDIEGSEYSAIATAIRHRVMCSAARNGTYMVMEEHPHFSPNPVPSGFLQAVNFITQYTESCVTQIVGGDDESFLHDIQNMSGPRCLLE